MKIVSTSVSFPVALALFSTLLSVKHSGAQVPDTTPVVRPSNEIELVVPATDGMIAWKDVAAALADSLKLDAGTVEKIFPTGRIDLRSGPTLLTIFGINLALGDAMSISMTRTPDGTPALRLSCDREAIGFLAPKRKQKNAEIQIDDDWQSKTKNKPLVICIHGLKSSPLKFKFFREHLRESGYATAAMSYDDHQSIVTSANQLSEIATQLLGDEDQQPEIVLIGHSMGGLVAREWTENPSINNDRISRLITVGTPHRGSNWASLPPLLDLFSSGEFDSGNLIDVILHQPSAPGLKALAPESAFLTKLADRKRSPGVKYTTIVGTGSPITEAEVAKLRRVLQKLDDQSSAMRLIRPRIQPLLQSFDELVQGKGDGVVAASRATIDGEKDIVSVPISHVEFFNQPRQGQKQPVWNAILERLQ